MRRAICLPDVALHAVALRKREICFELSVACGRFRRVLATSLATRKGWTRDLAADLRAQQSAATMPRSRTLNPRIKRTPPMPGRSVETLVVSLLVSVGTGMCGRAGLYRWLYASSCGSARLVSRQTYAVGDG
jgi:hypothetical protein